MGSHPARHVRRHAVLVVDSATYDRMQQWSVGDEDQINAAIATFTRLFGIDPPFAIVRAREVAHHGVEQFVSVE